MNPAARRSLTAPSGSTSRGLRSTNTLRMIAERAWPPAPPGRRCSGRRSPSAPATRPTSGRAREGVGVGHAQIRLESGGGQTFLGHLHHLRGQIDPRDPEPPTHQRFGHEAIGAADLQHRGCRRQRTRPSFDPLQVEVGLGVWVGVPGRIRSGASVVLVRHFASPLAHVPPSERTVAVVRAAMRHHVRHVSSSSDAGQPNRRARITLERALHPTLQALEPGCRAGCRGRACSLPAALTGHGIPHARHPAGVGRRHRR